MTELKTDGDELVLHLPAAATAGCVRGGLRARLAPACGAEVRAKTGTRIPGPDGVAGRPGRTSRR